MQLFHQVPSVSYVFLWTCWVWRGFAQLRRPRSSTLSHARCPVVPLDQHSCSRLYGVGVQLRLCRQEKLFPPLEWQGDFWRPQSNIGSQTYWCHFESAWSSLVKGGTYFLGFWSWALLGQLLSVAFVPWWLLLCRWWWEEPEQDTWHWTQGLWAQDGIPHAHSSKWAAVCDGISLSSRPWDLK